MKLTFFQWMSRYPKRWLLAALISLTSLWLTSLASYPVFSAQASGGEIESLASLLAIAQAELPQATPPPPVNDRAGQAILHPLGIGLALLFIILMVSLFRWMFHVPPQLPYAVVEARQSVSALHRILVPITTQLASERAVELACRLGETQKAEIILAYVVEVPFTLPLNAAMPIEQIKGQEALHTAQFIVEQHSLPTRTRLVPDRYTWGGILQLARSERVDAIVMSVGAERPGLTDGLGRTTQEILKRAECEVILDRAPNGRGR
jgi:nucleotide-binding universal stress UspA family protein